MTRKEQNKILDDKIESNVNQYKVDRLNAEISAFSSGDLNKYEFLTRKDLKYKPNALDKARFEFSPLGEAFSTGLDKTSEGYQEEGAIKLLKDIRDGLAGNVIIPNNRPNNRPDNGGNDGDNGDNEYDDNEYDDSFDTSDNKESMIEGLKDGLEKIRNRKKTDNRSLLNNINEQNYDNTIDDIYRNNKENNDKNVDDTSEKLYDSHGFDKDGFYKNTDRRYNPNGFDKDGFYKDTKNKYNPNGFDINAKHKDTDDIYDSNGFNIYGLHKDTKRKYNPNGSDINAKNKYANRKYNPNGFNIYGLHEDTDDI